MLGQIASVATALGIFVGLYQLMLARRQARASFEQEFVNRYWVIEDDRLRDGGQRDDVNRERYLRLCEDEFELMRLGKVSWGTWEIWHDGIVMSVGRMAEPHGLLSEARFEWIVRCSRAGSHRGHDCPALFEANPRNPRAAVRLRQSPGRAAVVVGGLCSAGVNRNLVEPLSADLTGQVSDRGSFR